jgi:hypothetical protein
VTLSGVPEAVLKGPSVIRSLLTTAVTHCQNEARWRRDAVRQMGVDRHGMIRAGMARGEWMQLAHLD